MVNTMLSSANRNVADVGGDDRWHANANANGSSSSHGVGCAPASHRDGIHFSLIFPSTPC
jgi:hypothetical protein